MIKKLGKYWYLTKKQKKWVKQAERQLIEGRKMWAEVLSNTNKKNMGKKIPVHKEEVLCYLKQTLTNALSTLDRLMEEDNPVLIRGEQTFNIGDKVEDKHCTMSGVIGIISDIDYTNKIAGVNFSIGYGSYEFSRLEKIIEKQKKENILEKGKEVLNSQNETAKFKAGDKVMLDLLERHGGWIAGEVTSVSSDGRYNCDIYHVNGIKGFGIFSESGVKLGIEKNKEVLFTTEDGIQIYEPCSIYSVDKESFKVKHINSYYFHNENFGDNAYKYFILEVKAKEYILMNKPLLSLNDLLSVWSYRKVDVSAKESPMFHNFQKLAQEKLNK